MTQYICLSYSRWQSVPTRTQQLVTRLKHAEIIFFEPYRDGVKPQKEGRKVRPGIFVYTMPPLPSIPEHFSVLFRRSWRKQSDFIAKVMAHHHFKEPVLWVTSPEQVHLVDHISCRGIVYDCDRDWSSLPLHWEGDLAAAADVVFAASPGLVYRLSPCNANIAQLPNGVNFPMFCRSDLDTPPELEDLTGPVFGWVGAITADLDLAPVEYAAGEHPDWNFVLIGPVKENPRLQFLKELLNVRLLGPRPMVEIPDYMGCFDVCLDLQRGNRLEHDLIPRRIYEYLSTGKPIVALLRPEQVEEFPDVIYGAHTLEEYNQMCARALLEDKSWVSPRRRDYGVAAAWSRRAEEVASILGAIGLE